EKLQSGVPVARDVGRYRFEAQAIPDGFRHEGLVLDDQDTHAPMLEPAHIVGVSKTTYGLATARQLHWRRDRQRPFTNNVPPDSDSQDPRGQPAGRHRNDRGGPRPSLTGDLVSD